MVGSPVEHLPCADEAHWLDLPRPNNNTSKIQGSKPACFQGKVHREFPTNASQQAKAVLTTEKFLACFYGVH